MYQKKLRSACVIRHPINNGAPRIQSSLHGQFSVRQRSQAPTVTEINGRRGRGALQARLGGPATSASDAVDGSSTGT